MFKRLLVPLDGSRLAETVLPVAQFLADCFDGTIILFHALEEGAPATIHGERHLKEVAEAQAYLDELAARVARPGRSVETNVHPVEQADIAGSMIDHIAELNADLVVLCAHGRSGWRDVLVGNIAQQVISRGTTPVLFVRSQTDEAPAFALHKILVPLDGTENHEPALPVAAELARTCQAALQLITVVPTTGTLSAERAGTGMLLPTTMMAVLDLAQRGAVEYLEKATTRLAGEGLQAAATVVRGDTPSGILDMVTRTNSDLIVLATHGRGNMDAFWSGSVTPKVLGRTEVPVLLVRVKGEEAQR